MIISFRFRLSQEANKKEFKPMELQSTMPLGSNPLAKELCRMYSPIQSELRP